MIVEPGELKVMAMELDSAAIKQQASSLIDYHVKHRINDTNIVMVPMYWAETLLVGLKTMRKEFPQLRFGSIIENRNRLRIITVPTHKKVEDMKIRLYNEIDMLILKTIDHIVKGDKKPSFIS